jgi:hypothetical protein
LDGFAATAAFTDLLDACRRNPVFGKTAGASYDISVGCIHRYSAMLFKVRKVRVWVSNLSVIIMFQTSIDPMAKPLYTVRQFFCDLN